MNWKKRTKEEVDASVAKKDYTGGYEFWPWLLYMRLWYVFGFLGNFFLGTGAGILTANGYAGNEGYIAWGFFGIFVPILIAYLLKRDYKKLKVGQSS